MRTLAELVKKAYGLRSAHFSEMSGAEINPTELVALYINQGATFAEGIQIAQDAIDGSCSMLLLTDEGVYAARDKLGRTPIILGQKAGAYAATLETCAFPNLGYETAARPWAGGNRPADAGGRRTGRPAPAPAARSALSSGFTTATRRPPTRALTPKIADTDAARRWPGGTLRPWTWWRAFPIPAPATPWVTPRKKACRFAGRS